MSTPKSFDNAALQKLLPLIYDELHRLAVSYMRRERADHTLQPTALVHEACMRLVNQHQIDWENRAQVLGVAANMMRRILVNYARDRAAGKRGGAAVKVTLSLADGVFTQPEVDLLAIDDALDRLGRVDERKSRIVEYKFFTGLTTKEIADLLEISVATVERDWTFSRAWLFRTLSESSASP